MTIAAKGKKTTVMAMTVTSNRALWPFVLKC
jgi:hypothetical protein